jgi:hypothetical protein
MMSFYELEEKIMAAWNVVDDIKLLGRNIMDGPATMTEDDVTNVLIGLETIYNMRFNELFKTYEKLLKEDV